MSNIDPVVRLKEMIANVKKDMRAHSRADLIDAAEAVFGVIEEEKKQINKGPFVAWLIHEVDSLDLQDVDAKGESGIPPFPEPLVIKPASPTPANAAGSDLVMALGKVDGVKTYGRAYKIRKGEKLSLPREAADFFRSHGFVE